MHYARLNRERRWCVREYMLARTGHNHMCTAQRTDAFPISNASPRCYLQLTSILCAARTAVAATPCTRGSRATFVSATAPSLILAANAPIAPAAPTHVNLRFESVHLCRENPNRVLDQVVGGVPLAEALRVRVSGDIGLKSKACAEWFGCVQGLIHIATTAHLWRATYRQWHTLVASCAYRE